MSTLPDMTDLDGLHQLGLVQCRTNGCTGTPVFHIGGPTFGKSGRVTLIRGPRAAFLEEPHMPTSESAVCLACALDAVRDLAGSVDG